MATEQMTPSQLDNPISSTDASAQKVVLVALAIVLALLIVVLAVSQVRRSEPYVRQVLSLSGDPVQGEVIFQLNCAVCHGIDAQGLVGPNLSHIASRKSRIGLIKQVISGKTPPMPQFQPSPETMADLLEYLERL